MKTKICTYCGEILKKSDNSCPNCGIKISTPQELPKANPFKRQKEQGVLKNVQPKTLGYLSILFGSISLFLGFGLGLFLGRWEWVSLELVLAVFALISGGIPIYRREINNVAVIGIILGGINFILFIYFAPIIWFYFW